MTECRRYKVNVINLRCPPRRSNNDIANPSPQKASNHGPDDSTWHFKAEQCRSCQAKDNGNCKIDDKWHLFPSLAVYDGLTALFSHMARSEEHTSELQSRFDIV